MDNLKLQALFKILFYFLYKSDGYIATVNNNVIIEKTYKAFALVCNEVRSFFCVVAFKINFNIKC